MSENWVTDLIDLYYGDRKYVYTTQHSHPTMTEKSDEKLSKKFNNFHVQLVLDVEISSKAKGIITEMMSERNR